MGSRFAPKRQRLDRHRLNDPALVQKFEWKRSSISPKGGSSIDDHVKDLMEYVRLLAKRILASLSQSPSKRGSLR